MAMLKGGNEFFASIDDKLSSSTKKVLMQSIEFKEAQDADQEAMKIYSKYKPINTAYSYHKADNEKTTQVQRQSSCDKDNSFSPPKVILYDPEKIEMNWKETRRIGPGFANLGNTCFLNSVLQVLTYTAPLVNFANSDAHRNTCVSVGFCMLCEFRNHVVRVSKHHPQNGPIRPMTVIQRLSCISKNFKFGRQEDAHEFLRYVIEALRKSCLVGKANLDRLSKETTAINQIFGGFFRSQVTCLSCKRTSSTYDPMMELNLDIKESNSIISALKKTISTEKLDGENKYLCEKCNRKTPALKKCNIHIAPKVLTLQLKRFDFQRLFGGKISKEVHFPETLDLSAFMSTRSETQVIYKLYAVLVHSGISCNSGHYYCYVKAPNGTWYEMNDSRVSQVGLQTVLRAQAYLLFYATTGQQSTKVVRPEAKSPYTNGKVASVPVQKKISSIPKDIGISIVRKEPRIVPLAANRDKVNFSFMGNQKEKVKEILKENKKSPAHPASPSQGAGKEVKSEKKTPTSIQSSLAAIRKGYYSSDSEEDVSDSTEQRKKWPEQEKKAKEAGKKVTKSEEAAQVIPKIIENVKVEEKKDTPRESKKTEKESSVTTPADVTPKVEAVSPTDKTKEAKTAQELLSPPKSANTDILHPKRKLKLHVGTPLSAKLGRWMPVTTLSGSFTPRAVLHRSMSDSRAVEKSRPTMRERQISVQEPLTSPTSHDKFEKSMRWNVEVKATPDINFGPMTPPVKPMTPNERLRERTCSVTSESGSIPTKTGDWDVHEKDLEEACAPPYIPERHFAGWSVEKTNGRKSEKKLARSEGTESASKKALGGKRTERAEGKSRSKVRDSEKERDAVTDSDDDEEYARRRKSKKRRHEAKSRDDDETEVHKKRTKRRHSKDDDTESNRKKHSSKKSKKKKHRYKSSNEDDKQESDEDRRQNGTDKKRRKSVGVEEESDHSHVASPLKQKDPHKEKELQRTENESDENSEEKHSKKKKKKKKKKKSKSDRGEEGSYYGRSSTNISTTLEKDGDNEESKCAAVKAPRRISFTTLSGKADSTDDKKQKEKRKSSYSKSKEEENNGYEKPIKSEKIRKNLSDAPAKNWDEAPKKTTSWNGSNDNTVLHSLLSKNSQVETWDNESSETMKFEVEDDSKRKRDSWDEEYDEGKVKKQKKRHSHQHSKPKGNLFQRLQNRRNVEKTDR